MLQAALSAKTEYNNIRAIASEASGLSGEAFSAQVNASQVEKTISKYSDNNGSHKSGGSSKGPLCCHGCGGPQPWSLLEHGIHVIKCPNANNPGICENAKKVINRIHSKRKRKQEDLSKRKNLATTNFSDFDAASQEHICNQVLNFPTKTASVASLITSMTGATSTTSPAKSASGKCIVFLYNAQALNTGVHRPVPPVTIQLIMPHINLQLGNDLSDSSSPILCCVVDTAAAPCTGNYNYYFFAVIAKQYPQCVAKIFLPEDYSPIVLSGIAQDNADAIATELLVAFQFHLPYFTKNGCTTSFVVAIRPHVSMNTVLGLPLITITGMILDFNDNVVQAKHFNCPPFPIDFCHATKTIPAFKDDKGPKTNYIEFKDVQQILQKTDAYIAGVCERIQSVPASTPPPLLCYCSG